MLVIANLCQESIDSKGQELGIGTFHCLNTFLENISHLGCYKLTHL